jgi:hypothetical protein
VTAWMIGGIRMISIAIAFDSVTQSGSGSPSRTSHRKAIVEPTHVAAAALI